MTVKGERMNLPLDASFRVICTREDEPAWLKARAEVVTASESPIFTSLNRWGSVLEVCGRKLGKVGPLKQTAAMTFGLDYEPILARGILADLQEEGLPYVDVLMDQRFLVSTRYPHLGCTPDAWLVKKDGSLELLELKTTRSMGEWGEGVPKHVWGQGQHQMVVAGQLKMRTGVFIRDSCERYHAPIELNTTYRDDVLLPVTERVHESLQAGVIPEETNYRSSRVMIAIAAIFPTAVPGEVRTLPSDFYELHFELEAAKSRNTESEKLMDEIKAQLKEAIGEAEFGNVVGTDIFYSLKNKFKQAYAVPEKKYRELRKCKPPKG